MAQRRRGRRRQNVLRRRRISRSRSSAAISAHLGQQLRRGKNRGALGTRAVNRERAASQRSQEIGHRHARARHAGGFRRRSRQRHWTRRRLEARPRLAGGVRGTGNFLATDQRGSARINVGDCSGVARAFDLAGTTKKVGAPPFPFCAKANRLILLRRRSRFFPIIVVLLKWKPCPALLERRQSSAAGSISEAEFASCSNRLDIPRPAVPSPLSCR